MSTQSTVCIIITIVLYLLFMLYLGFRFTNANQSVGDFYLGGRKLGPLVTAMSAEASDMSSWLLMGLPGVAYLGGICDAFWTALGLGIGTYLNWLLVAKRGVPTPPISKQTPFLTSSSAASWDKMPSADGDLRPGHRDLLYPLHRFRLLGLRQAVLLPVWV